MFNLLWIIFLFSPVAFSIEINSDSFMKEEESPSEEMTELELSAPNMNKRAYKKEKVIIKRDLSSLDSAISDLTEEELKANKDLKKENLEPASQEEQFLDYEDYKIRWKRRD